MNIYMICSFILTPTYVHNPHLLCTYICTYTYIIYACVYI